MDKMKKLMPEDFTYKGSIINPNFHVWTRKVRVELDSPPISLPGIMRVVVDLSTREDYFYVDWDLGVYGAVVDVWKDQMLDCLTPAEFIGLAYNYTLARS